MARLTRRLVASAAVLALLPAAAAAQEAATISGLVTTEANVPLPSASVFIEGLNLGTLTNDAGRYSFTVPGARVNGQQVTLTARVIGYRPNSVTITLAPGSITQNFSLELNPLRLGEVVVTGAGTETTREKLATAVSSVSAEEITRSNEENIVNALAAKAPGIEINAQSGDPGASSYIRIRGIKSIQGTGQPLFIVDGVPIDNSTFATGATTGSTVSPNRAYDINPADIASVDILKGAAAAAIYGARAAEGVVLITTKSGQSGQTRYSLRSSASWDHVSAGVPLQQEFGQGTRGVSPVCSNINCRLTSASWGPRLADGVPTYDQFAAVFEDGFSFDNTLSASGGNERTTFYASVGRFDQEGITVGPNDYYDRTTARLKASHRLFDNFAVSGNLAYTDAQQSAVQKGSNISGLLLGALRTPPNFNNYPHLDPETGLHRSYRFPNPGANSLRLHRGYDNPVFVALEQANESEVNRVMGNVSLDYDPFDWLQVDYTLGGDYYADWRLEGLPFTSTSYATGLVTRGDIINYQLDHSLVGTATRTFTPDLSGSLTLGQNLSIRRYRRNFTTGFDLIGPEPFALQNTVTWDPTEFRSLIHTESYYAQATADLYGQLFLTANIRNDGFSTFGAAQRRFWFPGFSAAWAFSDALGNEAQEGIFSYGKLRAAYGVAGKEPGVYQTLTVLATGDAGTGWGDYLNYSQENFGGLVTGGRLGNAAIEPEKTTEIEVGVDLGFFDQKMDLGVTYYNDDSKDIILSLPIPQSTGFSTKLENAAEIRNRGFEVALNARPVTRTNFAWDFGITWYTNDTEVIDLEGTDVVDKAAGTFSGSYGAFTLGQGLVMRGEDFVRCGRGLLVGGVAIDDGACTGAPDGALYIGPDGFPLYDPTDRVIANPQADWQAGLSSSVTLFQKLQLSTLVDIKQGGEVWNGTKGALLFFGTHAETRVRNAVQVFGQNGWYEGAVAGPGVGTPVVIDEEWYTSNVGSGFTGPASQFIEDGSYVKLREVSVAYNWSNNWLRDRLGFTDVDLRVSGRNLVTWTDYTGIDPETNLGGAEVAFQGADYFNNPQTRSVVFSIGLNR